MKDKKLIAARVIMTVLTVSAVAFIFFNSMQTADESSVRSGRLLAMINRFLCSMQIDFQITDHIVRKTAHFVEYSLLGILLCVTMYLYLSKRLRSLLLAVISGAAVAVCDELIQTASDGRSCQVSDMVLDSCGVACGALIVVAVISLIIKRKEKKKQSGV